MTTVALEQADSQANLPKPIRYLFGIAFAFAAILTAAAVWYVSTSSAPGSTASTIVAPSTTLLTVLWANLLLILSLGAVVGFRLFNLVASRNRAGAKLHLRFVMLFAGAAVIPAIVVAVFFGLLVTQGLDNWFSSS